MKLFIFYLIVTMVNLNKKKMEVVTKIILFASHRMIKNTIKAIIVYLVNIIGIIYVSNALVTVSHDCLHL